MTESTPSFFARLSLALGTFLRLLADGNYAAQVTQLNTLVPSALEQAPPKPLPPTELVTESVSVARDLGPAMQLLNLLQREGRLVDFLQQDIIGFPDADVGAAARVVHQGCRRAMQQALSLEVIRSEPEGAPITLEAGFDPRPYRLIGNVQGQPPYRGTLRHRGWRLKELCLEEPLATADLAIIAPAEVEL